MDKLELNDIFIPKLPSVLHKNTLPESYYPLIDDAQKNCQLLNDIGIKYSSTFQIIHNQPNENDKLIDQTGISKAWLDKLYHLLAFHSYKSISINKIQIVNKRFLQSLLKYSYKTTYDILYSLSRSNLRKQFATKSRNSIKHIDLLVGMLDLMRKPGIKEIKAELFIQAGVYSLKQLGNQDLDTFRIKLEKIIKQNTTKAKTVPTPKEIISDIYWAKIYPIIIDI